MTPARRLAYTDRRVGPSRAYFLFPGLPVHGWPYPTWRAGVTVDVCQGEVVPGRRAGLPVERMVDKGEKETILTPEGLRRLEEELEHLKVVRRKEIAERIKAAKDFGDLTENAEYEDAKNEQAFVEGRILQLEAILRNARVIDGNDRKADEVTVGCTVTLQDLSNGERLTYTIVGSAEADPTHDRISNESPVGRALLGRKKGETVEIQVPAGTLRYTVLDVRG